MNKTHLVIFLYNHLDKKGSRTRFFISCAKEFDRSANTIKNHWIPFEEIPDDDDDLKKDWMINYLEDEILSDYLETEEQEKII